MKATRAIAMFLTLGVGVAGILSVFLKNDSSNRKEKSLNEPQPHLTQAPRLKIEPKKSPEVLESFVRKNFGSESARFLWKEGRLIQIGGTVSQPVGSGKSFETQNEIQVRKRVQEILDHLKDHLGSDVNEWLGDYQIQMGPYSAQAYWRQTFQGVSVYPQGMMSLDLGPSGEIIGFYSSLYPNISPDPMPTKTHAGLVLWEGKKWAYETRTPTHQIIKDAKTGELILKKDLRQF